MNIFILITLVSLALNVKLVLDLRQLAQERSYLESEVKALRKPEMASDVKVRGEWIPIDDLVQKYFGE